MCKAASNWDLRKIPAGFPYFRRLIQGPPKHAEDAFSQRHPRMEEGHRAKIFAPFAALKGYEEALRAKEKIVVPKVELSDDALEFLDYQLKQLKVGDYVLINDGKIKVQVIEKTAGSVKTKVIVAINLFSFFISSLHDSTAGFTLLYLLLKNYIHLNASQHLQKLTFRTVYGACKVPALSP